MTNTPITDYAAAFETGGITSADLRAKTKISGWTSLMVFAIIAGSLLSVGYPIATFDRATFADNPWLGSLDIVIGVVLGIVGAIAATGLFRRLPSAVFWARVYFVLCFVTNLISAFGADWDALSRFESKSVVKGLIWSVIWFVYTFRSTQLETILPKRFRRVSRGEVVLALLLALTPVACFAVGFCDVVARAARQEVGEIRHADLPDGFVTDGHVIAAKLEGAIIQTPPDGQAGSCVQYRLGYYHLVFSSLLALHDTDADFEMIRGEAKSPDFADEAETAISDETRTVNGRQARIKVVRLGEGAEAYQWRFAMVVDPGSRKTALVSAYDKLDKADYFDELLNSIRWTVE